MPPSSSTELPLFSYELCQSVANFDQLSSHLSSIKTLCFELENDTAVTACKLNMILSSDLFSSFFSCIFSLLCHRTFSRDDFDKYHSGIIPEGAAHLNPSAELGHAIDDCFRHYTYLYAILISKIQHIKTVSLSSRSSDDLDFAKLESLSISATDVRLTPKDGGHEICFVDLKTHVPLSDIMDLLIITFDTNYSIASNIIQSRSGIFPCILEADILSLEAALKTLEDKFSSIETSSAHDFVLKLIADLKSILLLLCLYPQIFSVSERNQDLVFKILALYMSRSVPRIFQNLLEYYIHSIILVVCCISLNIASDVDGSKVQEMQNSDGCSDQLFNALRPVLVPIAPTFIHSERCFSKCSSFLTKFSNQLEKWKIFASKTSIIECINKTVGSTVFKIQENVHSSSERQMLDNLKEIFPSMAEGEIESILKRANWDPQTAFEMLSQGDQSSPSGADMQEIIPDKHEDTTYSYLGSTLDEILKTRIKIIVESSANTEIGNVYDEDDCQYSADKNPLLEDEPADDSQTHLNSQLQKEYLKNPTIFSRTARKSADRKTIKEKYCLTDEQIESWAKINMSSSDLKTQHLQPEYLDGETIMFWKGQQPSIDNQRNTSGAESLPVKKHQAKGKHPHSKKSHFQKDKALKKHLGSHK